MVNLTMADGNVVELTLNNTALLKLSELDGDICEKYYQALGDVQDNTSKRLFASMTICYVAYLCKLIMDDKYDQRMSYENFLDLAPEGFSLVGAGVTLVTSKKTKGSATPSTGQAKAESETV